MKNFSKLFGAASLLWAGAAFAIDAPTGLIVDVNSDGSASLSWSAVADATGYNIYRDDAYKATVESQTTYVDAVAGSSYYVTSFNSSVEPIDYSDASSVVAATGGGGGSGGGGTLRGCAALPSHAALTAALRASIAPGGGPANGGFDLHMWATVVDRDGKVCAVAKSGDDRGDQWPGSRVISAQKANTANAFSLPGLALATANLWAATQPGGSLSLIHI